MSWKRFLELYHEPLETAARTCYRLHTGGQEPGRGFVEDAVAASLTLPLDGGPFESPHLFPFFEGLLAEGSLHELQCRLHRIDPEDGFGLLLRTAASDVIGCVTVEPVSEE